MWNELETGHLRDRSEENRMHISLSPNHNLINTPNQNRHFENSLNNITIQKKIVDDTSTPPSPSHQQTSTPTKTNLTRNLNSPEENESASKKARKHFSN